ncbi:hypothetical protein B566_EDAN015397 [Ephemera danica]|nr:hypothetical protein B566_EDAN015397 [Ephemera danica]
MPLLQLLVNKLQLLIVIFSQICLVNFAICAVISSKMSFTKEMRKATRDVHDLSDALVNTKLAFALSNDTIWAEGLLIFYELFRFLEEAMDRLNHTLIGELDVPGMRRTDAFKCDLDFYLGKDWQKTYVPRKEVAQYVKYLESVENSDPHLLMAYIYHLYMGLLSGGQILQKKRQFFARFSPFKSQTQGYEITKFENHTISHIKRDLVKKMNEIAEDIGEDTKQKLIDESRIVFIKNNEIIRTVKGTSEILLRKIAVVSMVLIICWILYSRFQS